MLLLFSFIPSVNIAFLFGAYDSFYTNQNLEIVLYITQGIIGLSFGITFFAPLWASLPLKTENDFLSFRYSGKYVHVLKNVRTILLGVFIIPMLMALVLKAPLELFKEHDLSNQGFYITVCAFLCLYGITNSFKHRLKFDFSIGILFVIVCLFSVAVLINAGSLNHLKIVMKNQSFSNSNLFMAAFITWWFANIVDFPDMRAQKLLSASSRKSGYYSFLISNGFIMIIQGVFICLYAMFRFHSSTSTEIICLSVLLISCIVQLMNLQHWSGNLMHGIFQKKISNQRMSNFIPMIISTGIAYFICTLTDNIYEVIQGILFFSAGVGPVYVLRWFYFRINAITQLTAMISSLFLGLIYITSKAYYPLAFSEITLFYLTETNTVILVLGLINCLIWGSVMIVSQNDEANALSKQRIEQIKNKTRTNLVLKIFQFILTAFVLLLLFAGPYLLCIGV
ncbi:MAG: hypothetical protein ACOVNZ_04650 [Crocinitomicaceae bacterium]|jgi:SSS family solute:Na+ symporter